MVTSITPNKPDECELEERRSGHRITITVVSVDFVLMYNMGILVETLPLKKFQTAGNLLWSCAAFHSSVLCRTIITPNVYAVSVQVK